MIENLLWIDTINAMKSRKKLVAVVSIAVCIWSMGLLRVMFWPVLDDPEYDRALTWAESNDFPGIQEAKDYPFSAITRQDSAIYYVKLAQSIGLVPVRSECTFSDIGDLDMSVQETILLACKYGFFSWSNWQFVPEWYLTKGTSMVALMRWILPNKDFQEEEMYRLPYIEVGNELWITNRQPGPYVNYLITKYEFFLQLYRAYRLKL